VADAHVVSSLSPSGVQHRPLLDIDIPAVLVPSGTAVLFPPTGLLPRTASPCGCRRAPVSAGTGDAEGEAVILARGVDGDVAEPCSVA
jgi:hypothetical protein